MTKTKPGVLMKGQYHEAEAQVGDNTRTYLLPGKLVTLTNELTGSVYFRVRAGGQEVTAQVTDPVKLEQIGMSILAIARLKRQ